MHKPRTLLHLIFDMDGVLLNTLPFFNVICAVMINDAIQKMAGAPDYAFTSFDEIFNSSEIIGKRFPEKLEWVLKRHRMDNIFSKHHVAAQTANAEMLAIANELIERKAALVQQRPQGAFILADLQSRHLLDAQSGEAHIAAYDGVAEGLQALRDAGALLGVATNNPQARAEALLKTAGLDRYFDYITGIAGEVRNKDADRPDAYLAQHAKMIGHEDWKALRGADLSHVIGIEDSESGAKAVVAANMTLVGICHEPEKFGKEAETLTAVGARYVAPDFGALIDHLLTQAVPAYRPDPAPR